MAQPKSKGYPQFLLTEQFLAIIFPLEILLIFETPVFFHKKFQSSDDLICVCLLLAESELAISIVFSHSADEMRHILLSLSKPIIKSRHYSFLHWWSFIILILVWCVIGLLGSKPSASLLLVRTFIIYVRLFRANMTA